MGPSPEIRRSPRAGTAKHSFDSLTGLTCTLLLMGALGCSDERVTGVDVESLSIFPSEVSAFVGERREFRVSARDDRGQAIEPLSVDWSAEDPDIVQVASDGTVEALAPGVTRVVASFRGASDFSTVHVLAGPTIAVNRDSVHMSAIEGGPEPPAEVVYVANSGERMLEGLSATVDHDGGQDGWLDADLERSTAPTKLTLRASAEGLPVGVHRATVGIHSDAASNAPVEVEVVLAVEADDGTGGGSGDDPEPEPDPDDPADSGISIVEPGNGTEVSEGGGLDTVTVVLDSRPASDVVVLVSSVDPLEVLVTAGYLLVFTPTDWDDPRTIVVEGVDDLLPDGDQTVEILIAVNDALSSLEYHGLSVTIPVINRDVGGGD